MQKVNWAGLPNPVIQNPGSPFSSSSITTVLNSHDLNNGVSFFSFAFCFLSLWGQIRDFSPQMSQNPFFLNESCNSHVFTLLQELQCHTFSLTMGHLTKQALFTLQWAIDSQL